MGKIISIMRCKKRHMVLFGCWAITVLTNRLSHGDTAIEGFISWIFIAVSSMMFSATALIQGNLSTALQLSFFYIDLFFFAAMISTMLNQHLLAKLSIAICGILLSVFLREPLLPIGPSYALEPVRLTVSGILWAVTILAVTADILLPAFKDLVFSTKRRE